MGQDRVLALGESGFGDVGCSGGNVSRPCCARLTKDCVPPNSLARPLALLALLLVFRIFTAALLTVLVSAAAVVLTLAVLRLGGPSRRCPPSR
ncbi:hypothetical protein [Streptomyces sp. NPDC046182]|uniref:hypothetical protein n=1 Tax=Streptomyces sp. NPDC046182 TaxID=3154601 RepID=UPI0033C3C9F9